MPTFPRPQQKNYLIWIKYIVLSVLFSVVIYSFGRIAMLLTYGNSSEIFSQSEFLINDFIYGIRLDLKTSIILLSPFVLITGIMPYLSNNIQNIFLFLLKLYTSIYLIFCIIITVINYYYYGFFGNYIDVFIFDFLEPENRLQVTRTLFRDYMVLVILCLTIVSSVILTIVFWRIPAANSDSTISKIMTRYSTITFLVFFVTASLLARGSISERPLSRHRASLSPNVFFNQIMSNGAMALYRAHKQFIEADESYLQIPEEVLVKDFNFYFPGSNLVASPSADDYKTATTANEISKYPNVVLSVMESFGSRLIATQSPDNDVLGELATHIDQDYWFTNFTSEANDTVPSLEKIILNHASTRNISTSPHRNISFAASAAALFKRNGYKTIYITSGKKSWSDLDALFLNQGFDQVLDEYFILENVPGSKKARTWGVYDEYAYEMIYQILKNSTSQPVLIVLLTVTNHSPFEPPEDYEPAPINIPDDIDFNPLTDENKASRIITTYQYANDSLGRFISKIKLDQDLAENTLIAATGDHYLRYLFTYSNSELAWKYKVPFYLYLPDQYKNNTVKNLDRFGSHRDIFPTIYNRIFANENYYNLGTDLLGNDYNSTTSFSFNEEFVMNKSGAIYNDPETGADMFFKWSDKNFQELELANDIDEEQQRLKYLRDAYVNLKRDYTFQQLYSEEKETTIEQ